MRVNKVCRFNNKISPPDIKVNNTAKQTENAAENGLQAAASIFQPYYNEPLTEEDAGEMLANLHRLYRFFKPKKIIYREGNVLYLDL